MINDFSTVFSLRGVATYLLTFPGEAIARTILDVSRFTKLCRALISKKHNRITLGISETTIAEH